jgi:hypothetical protein
MSAQEIRLTDPVEALVVEQALALVRELQQTCQSAPHGHVLAQAELVALTRGRELTRQALEAVLNQQAEAAEKKGRRDEPVPAKAPATTKARPRVR